MTDKKSDKFCYPIWHLGEQYYLPIFSRYVYFREDILVFSMMLLVLAQ